MDRNQLDHHANQHNPNNIAHKHVNDNRSQQKNPQSSVYQTEPAPSQPDVKVK